MSNFTQEEFNILTADYVTVKEAEKYVRVDYLMDSENNIIESISEDATALDFATNKPSPYNVALYDSSCGRNCRVVDSIYKKITLKVDAEYGVVNNVSKVTITNEWSKVPTVKHYDLIGFKISEANSKFLKLNVGGIYSAHQYWDGNTWSYNFDTSTNTVRKTNGIVQIMNISDDVKTSLSNDMTVYFAGYPYEVDFDATYQGCISTSVTKSQARSLVLSGVNESGYRVLGGTIKFKDPIGNYYDGTAGLHLTVEPPYGV